MINCDTCPRCYDPYPDKVDIHGNHFNICHLTGNIVYTEPWKEKRYSGHGYIHHSVSTCGLYETIEDALNHMTKTEIERWKKERNHDRNLQKLQTL